MSEPAVQRNVTAAVLRRLSLLSLLPMLGVLLFGAGAALALRAFAHNSSLECSGGASGFADPLPGACSHYSYAVPIVVGVVGILLTMGGGAFASYYAARHVGLPLLATLQQRRRSG